MKTSRAGLVIGVTGGIATGKSTVLKALARLGAAAMSADEIAREVLARGTPAYRETLQRFGPQVLESTGEIARPVLARIIFADRQARDDLEAITHPRIIRRVRDRIREFRNHPPPDKTVLAVEIPLLIECGLEAMVDEVLVVAAEQHRQVDRLTTGASLSREEALARIGAQMPIERKIERADHVIWNDGTPEALEDAVKRFWEEIGRTTG